MTEIDSVVAAYDKYSPHRGRLDDPMDLQRMLKGAPEYWSLEYSRLRIILKWIWT